MAAFNVHTHFGPPSEPIPVEEFALDAAGHDHTATIAALNASVQTLSESERQRLELDLADVDTMREEVEGVLNDPKLAAYVAHRHEQIVTTLAAKIQIGDMQRSVKRRGERRATHAAPDLNDPDIAAFDQRFELDPLRIFQLDGNASSFMIPQRLHHTNVVETMRPTRINSKSRSGSDAVLVVSFYERSNFDIGGYHRASQHALLSSQTLEDLMNCNTCPLAHRPAEDDDTETPPFGSVGCVVIIENVAYSDGANNPDYADKLLAHFAQFPKDPPLSPPTKSSTTFANTPLDSLQLRINEPYFILHQGNCEHLLMVDVIRAAHADDPEDGYPHTLHISPSNIQLCRICTKYPASFAIAYDVRMGESPSVACRTCWSAMGLPRHLQDVVVVTPLRFAGRVD